MQDRPTSFNVTTANPDLAEATVASNLAERARFSNVQDRNRFAFRMEGVRMGSVLIGYNRFATETVLEAVAEDDLIALAISADGTPGSTFQVDDETVDLSRSAALVSAERRLIEHRPSGSDTLLLRTHPTALAERFREIADRMPSGPIRLDRSAPLQGGPGATVHRQLRLLTENAEQTLAIAENPLLRAGYEDLLLSSMLALPGNLSRLLEGAPRRSVAPWMVRRAEEYLEANAAEPVTVSDLVRECGCSRAALQAAFRRFRGYSPMQFLAKCRLELARRALKAPYPGDSVGSIAYASGFAHLGRFSKAYRERFGEKPSETLRRAPRSSDRHRP